MRGIGVVYRRLSFLAAVKPRAILRRIMGKVFAPRSTRIASAVKGPR